MKIDAPFLTDPALHNVMMVLDNAGYRTFIVGGAIRNAVLGKPTGDVDIATDAHPQNVLNLVQSAGLKAIPTGIEHGTVTVIVNGTPFEVTTFRRDIETDGRRAIVAFSDRIEDDAARRDFTMNALYATADGKVIDPIGGWSDLNQRKLRFVGNPTTRIREDYLRILRFFRFLAWYGKHSDPDAIRAIHSEYRGLDRVSAERIGAELRKLLTAPNPAPAIRLMQDTGVLVRILPDADPSRLPALITAETGYAISPDWRRRLAVMTSSNLSDRLRLSRNEATYLSRLNPAQEETLAEIAFHNGAEIARDVALIRLASDWPVKPDWPKHTLHASTSPLPVSAADLMPELTGPAIGRGLKAAEELWIKTNFTASKTELIKAAHQTDTGKN